jgi:diguanylate cyclase (GGDEF)-like protein
MVALLSMRRFYSEREDPESEGRGVSCQVKFSLAGLESDRLSWDWRLAMKVKVGGWKLNTIGDAPRKREVKLRQIPGLDDLTVLAVCHGLSESVKSEIKRSKRSGRDFAVLVFDLNGRKQTNARHGTQARDRALRRLAHILRFSCRSIDTAARYGDDKMAIVLPECGAEAADAVERRIRERLSMDREEPVLSVSVGIAAYPGDGKTPDSLFQAAVRALYKKKEKAEDTVDPFRILPFVSFEQKGFLFHLRSIQGLMRELRGGPNEP